MTKIRDLAAWARGRDWFYARDVPESIGLPRTSVSNTLAMLVKHGILETRVYRLNQYRFASERWFNRRYGEKK